MESLELCGLTASLLNEFKDIATTERDRVEFCSNDTYRLLEERKVRNKKRSAPDNPVPNGGGENEVVELL